MTDNKISNELLIKNLTIDFEFDFALCHEYYSYCSC